MSPEYKKWQQRFVRGMGVALVAGATSLYAEPQSVVYPQTIEKRETDFEAVISNVAKAYQRNDIDSLKKYYRESDYEMLAEDYKRISSYFLSGDASLNCLAYVKTGSEFEYPGATPGDIRLLIRWTWEPSKQRGHSPYGGGSIIFTPDNTFPLGWRVKQFIEEDMDLIGEDNFISCSNPLSKTPPSPTATARPAKELPTVVPQKVSLSSYRRLVFQTGLTSEVDTSGSAMGRSPTFEELQWYLAKYGYKGQDHINVTRRNWEVLPDGRYMAGELTCEDSLEHPEFKAHNLVKILLELNKKHPSDDFVVLGHSEGGVVALLALQNIRNNLIRNPDYPIGPHNVHFIIAHSPVGGVKQTWLMGMRKILPNVCEAIGMPDTNSDAVTYLRERWDNRDEELAKIRKDVEWWVQVHYDENGEEYQGHVVGLYNISDKIYAPGNAFMPKFWLSFLSLTQQLPKEILTQIVPGAKNKEFHLYDGLTNHRVIYTSEEGKKYIANTIGEQRKG